MLSKLNKLDAAQKSLTTAKEKFGTDKSNQINVYFCRYNLGINYRKLGDHDRSIGELKEAITLQHEKPSVFNNLGLTYFEKSEMDAAIGEFSKAIKLDQNAVHYNNRGLAYFHDRQITSALEDFDKALELNTVGDPTIYFNRGNALLSENRFEEAIDDYEKASKIAPQNPKYHHAKGIAYEALAAKVEKEHGKQKRFDLEVMPVEMRCSDDMASYLRDDYLRYSKDAIEMYK